MLPPDARLDAVPSPVSASVAPARVLASGFARLALLCALSLALVPLTTGPTAAAQSPGTSGATVSAPITETVHDSAGVLLPYESTCAKRTDIQATIILPVDAKLSVLGRPLMPGDQIAVFSDDDVCAGFVTWTGGTAALTIWGDDLLTSEVDGLLSGHAMHLRVRTASSGIEHSARNGRVTLTFRDNASHLTVTPTFMPDGIYVVETLSIDAIEHANGAE